jgi:hypothetical protein
MLWKKDTLPPSSLAFKVTMAAPHHVTMKTAPKTRPLSSVAVSAGLSLLAGELWLDRRMASVRHRMSGPHRSQSLSSAPAYAERQLNRAAPHRAHTWMSGRTTRRILLQTMQRALHAVHNASQTRQQQGSGSSKDGRLTCAGRGG